MPNRNNDTEVVCLSTASIWDTGLARCEVGLRLVVSVEGILLQHDVCAVSAVFSVSECHCRSRVAFDVGGMIVASSHTLLCS